MITIIGAGGIMIRRLSNNEDYIIQELAETESYKCSGVVSSLERGQRAVEVGWLVCPLACQGRPSCLPMCCPPGQWWDGSSCQTAANQSDWIEDLQQAEYSFEWSGYSNGLYHCDPDQFTQVNIVEVAPFV